MATFTVSSTALQHIIYIKAVRSSGTSATSVTLEYKLQSSGTWLTGADAYLIPSTSNTFVGFFLATPGEDYDYRIVRSGDTTATSTASALDDPSTPAAVRTRYVSPTGSGTIYSAGTPGDLATAIGDAAAGDHIICQAGTYYVGGMECATNGTSSDPILVIADDGAAVTFTGASETNYSWSRDGEFYKASMTGGDDDASTVTIDGYRIFKYASTGDLANYAVPSQEGDFEVPGFAVSGGDMYMKWSPDRFSDMDPDDHDVKISREYDCFEITGDWWIIDGVSFDHYGNGYWPRAITVDADDCLIQNCIFTMCDRAIKIDSADRTVVQYCEFFDNLDYSIWKAVKSGTYYEAASTVEIGASAKPSPKQTTIRYNYFHDLFDGLQANLWGDAEGSGAVLGIAIYGNNFLRLRDDGFECDYYATGTAIWGNTFRDTFNGISNAQVLDGPFWAWGNYINPGYYKSFDDRAARSNTAAFKINANRKYDGGVVSWWNNTIYAPTRPSGRYNGMINAADLYTIQRLAATNNVVHSASQCMDMDANGVFDISYNCWHRTSSGNAVNFQGDGIDTTAEFIAAGQGAGSLFLDPQLNSPSTGDYTLRAASACIGSATAINGILTSGNRGADQGDTDWHGLGPDAGPVGGGGTVPGGGGTPGEGETGTGSLALDAPGTTGTYLRLDSASRPAAMNFSRNDAWTFACLFRVDSFSDDLTLFELGRTNGMGCLFQVRVTGVVRIRANGDYVVSTETLSTGTWYLGALRCAGSASMEANIWTLDGTQIVTDLTSTMGTTDYVSATDGWLDMFARTGGTLDAFNGAIALPVFYDSERTDAELLGYLADPWAEIDDADCWALYDFGDTSPEASYGGQGSDQPDWTAAGSFSTIDAPALATESPSTGDPTEWSGDTWTITTTQAWNTPAVGDELASGNLTLGQWYLITATETDTFYTGCAINDTFRATAATGLDASNKVRIITEADLYRTFDSIEADVRVTAEIDSRDEGQQIGVVFRYADDDNLCIAYLDGGNVIIAKNVAGTWTEVDSTAYTWSAGSALRIDAEGDAVDVYYGGVQVGTTHTIADGATNTIHGVFSARRLGIYDPATFKCSSITTTGGGTTYALSHDGGPGDYLSLADSDGDGTMAFGKDNAWTIAAFIKVDSFADGAFYEYSGIGGQNLYIRVRSINTVNIRLNQSSLAGIGTLSTDTWYFVCATNDGADTTGSVNLYVHETDGTVNAERAFDGPFAPDRVTADGVHYLIGSDDNGAGSLPGDIAYFTFFDAELSAAEVDDLRDDPWTMARTTLAADCRCFIDFQGTATEDDTSGTGGVGRGNDFTRTGSLPTTTAPTLTEAAPGGDTTTSLIMSGLGDETGGGRSRKDMQSQLTPGIRAGIF